ncbi:hypothetical protein L1887_57070 [Cichorium endivia]|nr:hypothetical protein L1887_57070 [Cichorium endivia]
MMQIRAVLECACGHCDLGCDCKLTRQAEGGSACSLRHAGMMNVTSSAVPTTTHSVEVGHGVEQSHVGAADERVCDLRVEGRDADKLHRRRKASSHSASDDHEEVARSDGCRWHAMDDRHGQHGESEAEEECHHPRLQRLVALAPPRCKVAKDELEGEVDEHRQREVLLAESLFDELESCDCLVCLEADLGDKVDEDESLDVFELADAPHDRVDLLDVHVGSIVCLFVFLLEEEQPCGHHDETDCPETHVGRQRQERIVERCGSEVLVAELDRVERKEDGEAEEVARVEAYSLGRAGVREILLREQRERPAVDRNVLRGGKEDEHEEDERDELDVWQVGEEQLVDVAREVPEHDADDGLDGHDPALAATERELADQRKLQLVDEGRVDDGAPEELERVRIRAEHEEANVAVAELGLQKERHGAECKTDGNTLKQVKHDEKNHGTLVARREVHEAGSLLAALLLWIIGLDVCFCDRGVPCRKQLGVVAGSVCQRLFRPLCGSHTVSTVFRHLQAGSAGIMRWRKT